jgi:hypothetical protein
MSGAIAPDTEKKERNMKKILVIIALLIPVVLAACSRSCETEPIVEENHKLIVPPHFGARPAK